jgi:hypothetical protein
MKKLFQWASAFVASVPGLAGMAAGVGTPPGSKAMFGAAIEAFGGLTVLLLFLNKKTIKGMSDSATTRWVIVCGACAFGSIVSYMLIYQYCLIQVEERTLVYFPLWTTGQAAVMVERAGGRAAAIEMYGSAAVEGAIGKMSSLARPVTTTILLALYQGIFSMLALAFGLVGFRTGAVTGDR